LKRNLHLKVCFWHQTTILSKILIKKRTADSEITRVKSICLLVTNSSFLASDKKASFFSQIWSVHSNYIYFFRNWKIFGGARVAIPSRFARKRCKSWSGWSPSRGTASSSSLPPSSPTTSLRSGKWKMFSYSQVKRQH
jgi:hypothetical protein